MIRCSRLDLFQTGTTSVPCSVSFIQARNCAFAWCAKRSPTPIEYLASVNIAHSVERPRIGDNAKSARLNLSICETYDCMALPDNAGVRGVFYETIFDCLLRLQHGSGFVQCIFRL